MHVPDSPRKRASNESEHSCRDMHVLRSLPFLHAIQPSRPRPHAESPRASRSRWLLVSSSNWMMSLGRKLCSPRTSLFLLSPASCTHIGVVLNRFRSASAVPRKASDRSEITSRERKGKNKGNESKPEPKRSSFVRAVLCSSACILIQNAFIAFVLVLRVRILSAPQWKKEQSSGSSYRSTASTSQLERAEPSKPRAYPFVSL